MVKKFSKRKERFFSDFFQDHVCNPLIQNMRNYVPQMEVIEFGIIMTLAQRNAVYFGMEVARLHPKIFFLL